MTSCETGAPPQRLQVDFTDSKHPLQAIRAHRKHYAHAHYVRHSAHAPGQTHGLSV